MSKRKLPVHWRDAALRLPHNPFADVSPRHLDAYDMELRQMMSAADAEAARLRSVAALVTEAKRRRDNKAVVITDHAIVRYMERYMNVDMTYIEDAILEMARDGRKEIAMRDSVIITVLPPGSEATDDKEAGANYFC